MTEFQKEYIEFRLILLGYNKVGKKSFIDRLFNISSTTIIRNKELELQYKNQILNLRKKYEKHKKFLEDIAPLDKNSKKKEDLIKRLNDKTTRSSKSIRKEKATAKIQEEKSQEKIESSSIEVENKYILKVTSDEQYFSKNYVRPPIPEHPAKLFNINKSKICIKPYYILPPEKLDFDYNPDADYSDNEIDTEFNVSFKGVKYDVRKIISNKKTIIEEEKLTGYKISVYNIFLFVYDMSDFDTFEAILKYFSLLEKKFQISQMENSIIYLIGNKKDKKVLLDIDQVTSLNQFLKDNNIPFYEISTRSYFNFDKFFIEFIIKALSKNHKDLIKEDTFKSEFEKIAYNKPTFSRAKRETYQKKDTNVGPKYYANIFGFNSNQELSETFNNEKLRFNKKIFCNKTGPKYFKSKSNKDINININLNNINNNIIKLEPELFETKGGLLNKPVQGFQFGIVNGKLNLLKIRKKLKLKRNKNLQNSFEDGSSLFTQNVNSMRIRGDEYFEQRDKRKRDLLDNKKEEKKIYSDEIKKLHIKNLEKMENEKNILREKIFLSQNKNNANKNTSFPNLLSAPDFNYNYTSNINNINENQENEMLKTSKRYTMHQRNKKYLEEYELILKRIKLRKKAQSPEPGPNSYDIRTNLLDKNKGFSITGKRKEISPEKNNASFPDLQDEFDMIVSKAINNNYNQITYSPWFKKLVKEKYNGPYRDQKIWKNWELNKIEIEKNKARYFFDNLKEKKKKQLKKVELIKQQTEEIIKLRNEILKHKGYDDPSEIRSINYSQVETSPPCPSLKGRHIPKIQKNENFDEIKSTKNIKSDDDLMNYYINNIEIFRPLPNSNYVKPNLPSWVFGKAERFTAKEYQGSQDLFKNGVFDLKTQENFAKKSPYESNSQRTNFGIKKEKSPSPIDYIIKSGFDLVVEKGKKINEIRSKIRFRENLKNIKDKNDVNDTENNNKKTVKINKININKE